MALSGALSTANRAPKMQRRTTHLELRTLQKSQNPLPEVQRVGKSNLVV